MTRDQLRGWTPVHVSLRDPEPLVEWGWLGDERFSEPFFTGTVMRAMQRPFNHAFRLRTPLAALDAFADGVETVPLRGFIFHMSRCGSTLISQMLAALPRSLVLSEPQPLSQILRLCDARPDTSDEEHVRAIRGVTYALSSRRDAAEREAFVKLASMDVLWAASLRKAFPEVPCAFVFRDPGEVLASHAKLAAGEVLLGAVPPTRLGVDAATLSRLGVDEVIVRSLHAACRAALQLDAAFVDYRMLPRVVTRSLAEYFGVFYDEAERAHMLRVAERDAKRPQQRFEPDAERKRRDLRASTRQLAAEWLAAAYEEMGCRSAMMFPSESIA